MADNIYSQAYATQQSPDLAGALMDLERSKELKSRYAQNAQRFNDPSKMVGATSIWGSIGGLVNQYRENEEQDRMRDIQDNRVNPAMQQLIQSVMGASQGTGQEMGDGGQSPYGSPPKTSQEYMQNMQRLGLMKSLGIPGSEEQFNTYGSTFGDFAKNAPYTGGSLSPEDIANAKAYQQNILGKQFDQTKVIDPQTGMQIGSTYARDVINTNAGKPPVYALPDAVKTENEFGQQVLRPTAEVLNPSSPERGALTPTSQAQQAIDQVKAHNEEYRKALPQRNNTIYAANKILEVLPKAQPNQNYATLFGNALGKQFATEGQSNNEFVAKYLNELALASGVNANTDLGRELSTATMPNTNMDPRTITKLVTKIRNVAQMNNDKDDAVFQLAQRGARPQEVINFKTELNKIPVDVANMPSNIERMSPQEKAQFKQNLKQQYGDQAADRYAQALAYQRLLKQVRD